MNLCESVEKNWLVLKEDSRFNWSFPVRDKYLNTNYVQFQHEPFEVMAKLYIPNLVFVLSDNLING